MQYGGGIPLKNKYQNTEDRNIYLTKYSGHHINYHDGKYMQVSTSSIFLTSYLDTLVADISTSNLCFYKEHVSHLGAV